MSKNRRFLGGLLTTLLLSILMPITAADEASDKPTKPSPDSSNIKKDTSDAASNVLENYRKAAENGDPEAMANLGYMYQEGLGTPQNYSKAISWFRKAADKGSAKAMLSLGFVYLI